MTRLLRFMKKTGDKARGTHGDDANLGSGFHEMTSRERVR